MGYQGKTAHKALHQIPPPWEDPLDGYVEPITVEGEMLRHQAYKEAVLRYNSAHDRFVAAKGFQPATLLDGRRNAFSAPSASHAPRHTPRKPTLTPYAEELATGLAQAYKALATLPYTDPQRGVAEGTRNLYEPALRRELAGVKSGAAFEDLIHDLKKLGGLQ